MTLSLLDLLANHPSTRDRMMQLLSLMPQQASGSSGAYASGSSDPNAGGGGDTVAAAPTSYTYDPTKGFTAAPTADGSTQYAYKTWPKPYTGVPPNMVTRFGVTLQRGPMHSLMDIARASGIMPGAREVGLIGQGYRSYDAQAALYADRQRNGGAPAAPPGSSYHGQGLAIDAGEWARRNALRNALISAGWNQFDASLEPWHFSYGVTG